MVVEVVVDGGGCGGYGVAGSCLVSLVKLAVRVQNSKFSLLDVVRLDRRCADESIWKRLLIKITNRISVMSSCVLSECLCV